MYNQLVFEQDARNQIFKGMEKVAKAVAVSLGPKGKLAIIENNLGAPIITKDGVSIAKAVNLEDPMENLGASLIKEGASKSGKVGDGTSTTAVLGYAMAREGLKVLSSGASSSDLRRGIEKAKDKAVECIKKHSSPVSGKNDITNVAKIASNNDEKIGNLVSEAFERIGENGTVTVAESPTTETYLDFTEGMNFSSGMISPHFVTDIEKLRTEFKDAYVLVTDEIISSVPHIANLLNEVAQSGKPLLIVAEDFGGEVIPTLVFNKLKGALNVCAVKAPYFGETRKGFLEDLSVLTGGMMVSSSMGVKLENLTLQHLGHADKIIVSRDETTVIGGMGSDEALQDRILYLKRLMEEETSEFTKEKIAERIAKLSGGVCVLNVYADTEPEMKELKDRIEDTLASVRASMKDGIVLGGGVTLLKVAQELAENMPEMTEDEKIGYNIFVKALDEPIRQLAENAGLSADLVVSKTKESNNSKGGYNMATGVWEDDLFDKVVDPTLVEISALQNASSIVGLLLNTEVAITNIKEKSEAPTMPMMHM